MLPIDVLSDLGPSFFGSQFCFSISSCLSFRSCWLYSVPLHHPLLCSSRVWWAIRPISHRVSVNVNSTRIFVYCWVLNASLADSYLFLESTADRCTAEKVVSKLRQPAFHAKQFEVQMKLFERCGIIAKAITDRELNSIWHALFDSLIRRSSVMSSRYIIYRKVQ